MKLGHAIRRMMAAWPWLAGAGVDASLPTACRVGGAAGLWGAGLGG